MQGGDGSGQLDERLKVLTIDGEGTQLAEAQNESEAQQPQNGQITEPETNLTEEEIEKASIDSAIIQALQTKERETVLEFEQSIVDFIGSTAVSYEFRDDLSPFQRMLAHRISQYYGLQTRSKEYQTNNKPGCVIAEKGTGSTDVTQLVKLSEVAKHPSFKMQKKVLQRPRPPFIQPGQSPHFPLPNDRRPVEHITQQQRQSQYKEARDRIFSEGAHDVEQRGGKQPTYGVYQQPGTSSSNASHSYRFPPNNKRPSKATFRDKEKDKLDPDYRRESDRYQARYDPGFGSSHQGQNLYVMPTYSTEFPALGAARPQAQYTPIMIAPGVPGQPGAQGMPPPVLMGGQQMQYPHVQPVFVPVPASGAMAAMGGPQSMAMPYPPYQMFSPPLATTPDGMPLPISYIPQMVPMNFGSQPMPFVPYQVPAQFPPGAAQPGTQVAYARATADGAIAMGGPGGAQGNQPNSARDSQRRQAHSYGGGSHRDRDGSITARDHDRGGYNKHHGAGRQHNQQQHNQQPQQQQQQPPQQQQYPQQPPPQQQQAQAPGSYQQPQPQPQPAAWKDQQKQQQQHHHHHHHHHAHQPGRPDGGDSGAGHKGGGGPRPGPHGGAPPMARPAAQGPTHGPVGAVAMGGRGQSMPMVPMYQGMAMQVPMPMYQGMAPNFAANLPFLMAPTNPQMGPAAAMAHPQAAHQLGPVHMGGPRGPPGGSQDAK